MQESKATAEKELIAAQAVKELMVTDKAASDLKIATLTNDQATFKMEATQRETAAAAETTELKVKLTAAEKNAAAAATSAAALEATLAELKSAGSNTAAKLAADSKAQKDTLEDELEDVCQELVRCAYSDRNLHSRIPRMFT
jgi:predicted component of type VI protein secretion system